MPKHFQALCYRNLSQADTADWPFMGLLDANCKSLGTACRPAFYCFLSQDLSVYHSISLSLISMVILPFLSVSVEVSQFLCSHLMFLSYFKLLIIIMTKSTWWKILHGSPCIFPSFSLLRHFVSLSQPLSLDLSLTWVKDIPVSIIEVHIL